VRDANRLPADDIWLQLLALEAHLMWETISIRIPGMTREVIERLKRTFHVTTDAEVVSRALGLANAAVQVAGTSNTVKLSGPETTDPVVVALGE
jgi:hypothetical protein